MLEPRGSKPDLKRSLENGRLESMLFETCPPSLDTPTGPAVTHCDRGPTLKPSGAAVVSNVQIIILGMCGIFVSLFGPGAEETKRDLKDGQFNLIPINRRGPDSQKAIQVQCEDVDLYFYGSVLHMRGDLCTQPLLSNDNYLLWNGEVFGGVEVPLGVNDGEIVLGLLCSCKTDEEVMNVIADIQGPFALVFYQSTTKQLWFARDIFGRRSLMFHTLGDVLYLSSVAVHVEGQLKLSDWTELPAAGIYMTKPGLQETICYQYEHTDMRPPPQLQTITRSFVSLPGLSPLNMSIDDTIVSVHQRENDQVMTAACQLLGEESKSFVTILEDAVSRRVGQDSYYCTNCRLADNCDNAHISIMFSGGIDSMMLAFLSDRCVPIEQAIDLLNVAFETSSGYNVPDRITGREALQELNPERKWNFVEIDVAKEELITERTRRIHELILPLDTVLDDSIGCAMWFASRGRGLLNGKPYTSPARVVLSGLGADEQLGGYSRHRSSYQSKGFSGLLQELAMDVNRISARNLGRDDRIISDHGKEARFPFLDECVVSYLNQLPVYKKMDLSLKRGIGEKLLLRVAAMLHGLPKTAVLAKRAIQFGSRIAKCENRKEKGSDMCTRLLGS